MTNNIYAAVEIGTTRTVLAVGEGAPGGRVTMLGHTEIPSCNVRKSRILNIEDATRSLKSVISAAEKELKESSASLTLCTAYLVVSGNHISVNPFQVSTMINGNKVEDEEIDDVQDASHNYTLGPTHELLDIVEQDYAVDNLTGITAPKGMAGHVLKLNTLQIIADKNRIQDAKTAAQHAKLEIDDSVFACTSAADAVLTEREKRDGALVLDLGGGSTGYSVYADGYLVSAGVIGVGGDHITNDIAHAFQTTNAVAEKLKIDEASAILSGNMGRGERIHVSSSSLMDKSTISRRSLNTVVNARVKELLRVIRDILEKKDLLNRLQSGIVLVGGSANLNGITSLTEQVLGYGVRIGKVINIDGLENEKDSHTFAAVAGALMYANRESDDTGFLGGILGRFFKK